jgi:hypothetical protein
MGISAATASLGVGWGSAGEAVGRRLPPPRLLERPKRASRRFLVAITP